MALINCPECGKEISDKSKVCIHCGFPLKSDTICNINGIEYDLGFILDENINNLEKVGHLGLLKSSRGFTVKYLGIVWAPIMLFTFSTASEKSQLVISINSLYFYSTNIEKISLGKKAVGGAMFGIFSSNVRKTMHCKSCGYKW